MTAPANTVRFLDSRRGLWRYGTLISQDDKVAMIRPLVPGAKTVKVPLDDMEPVEGGKP